MGIGFQMVVAVELVYYSPLLLKGNFERGQLTYEGLDGGVWNSLISKNLAHYSLSLKFLLIL